MPINWWQQSSAKKNELNWPENAIVDVEYMEYADKKKLTWIDGFESPALGGGSAFVDEQFRALRPEVGTAISAGGAPFVTLAHVIE